MLKRGHYNSNAALGEDFLKIEVNEEKHSLQKIIAVCNIKNISKFDIEHPLLDISKLSKLLTFFGDFRPWGDISDFYLQFSSQVVNSNVKLVDLREKKI